VIPEPATLIPIKGLTTFSAIKLGFSEIGNTFRELRRFKVILLYLCAYLLFNDGIQTVLGIAGAFAADTLGIPLVFNMATILIIQFVAAGGAMAFSRLSSAISTKKALTVSLIGWIFIVLFGVALAPLIPSDHQNHDYQLEFNQNKGAYTVTSAPELGDSREENLWGEESGQIISGDLLSVDNARSLISSVGKSQYSLYSISALKGPLNNERVVGGSHPSAFDSGTLDWWPSLVRKTLWAPLGIKVVYQWLLLGLGVGIVMGGSQALSRSLFAQISPETRSGEFFSFFGFMSRASSVFGPMLYIFVTGILDTRSAVFSILLIIIAGTIVLKWVDVDAGAHIAKEEDQRIRASSL
jgi:MFS-type transporter involved in bile tolerance (Atg22 family)